MHGLKRFLLQNKDLIVYKYSSKRFFISKIDSVISFAQSFAMVHYLLYKYLFGLHHIGIPMLTSCIDITLLTTILAKIIVDSTRGSEITHILL